MRTLERDKKPLYLCKKILNTEPTQFEKPIKIKLNTVATVSETDIVAFGDEYKEYRRATVNMRESQLFSEGDRVYLYNKPPLIHDPLGNQCDFEVTSVSDSVSQVQVLFKRLQIGKD